MVTKNIAKKVKEPVVPLIWLLGIGILLILIGIYLLLFMHPVAGIICIIIGSIMVILYFLLRVPIKKK